MSYKIDTGRLDEIIAKLNGNADKICRRAAFEIEREAKQLAPVDTAALRNSIYVATKNEDGFSKADAAAKAKNNKVKTRAHPKPEGDVRAVVGPCVEYAAPVEFGHLTKPFRKSYGAQRFIPGHPFLKPAAEIVTKRFVEMWQKGLFGK